jgi:hypothetical protein
MAELDLDGSGMPADASALSELGVTDAERLRLAALYSVGQELWRVPIPHFSPWDCNWPYGPPADAVAPPDTPWRSEDAGSTPDPSDPYNPDDPDEHDPDEPAIHEPQDPDILDEHPSCQRGYSEIECPNQTLRKTLQLPGIPLTLNYSSDRVRGRSASWSVSGQLAGETVPSSLERIDLVVEIAGRYFSQSYEPVPDLNFSLEWDGKDTYGRLVQGEPGVRISVGYVYPAVYYGGNFSSSFSRFPEGVAIGGNREANEVTLWRTEYGPAIAVRRTLGGWDARSSGLGGWSLAAHHTYDPGARVLRPGWGGRRNIGGYEGGLIAYRAAGIGDGSPAGDGGPARDATISSPSGLSVEGTGALLVADDHGSQIRRILPDGTISTVAGIGPQCLAPGGSSGSTAALPSENRHAL